MESLPRLETFEVDFETNYWKNWLSPLSEDVEVRSIADEELLFGEFRALVENKPGSGDEDFDSGAILSSFTRALLNSRSLKKLKLRNLFATLGDGCFVTKYTFGEADKAIQSGAHRTGFVDFVVEPAQSSLPRGHQIIPVFVDRLL